MKTSLDPPGLPKPVGPYANVTHAPADGRLVFCAGTVALDETGQVVGEGDVAQQTEQVMENLKLALAAAGATFDDVVKITTYMTDVTRFAELAAVRARYLTPPYPAATLLEVQQLMWPELLVEIEAIAVVSG